MNSQRPAQYARPLSRPGGRSDRGRRRGAGRGRGSGRGRRRGRPLRRWGGRGAIAAMFGRSDGGLCCRSWASAVLEVDWMHAGPKIERGGGLETLHSASVRRRVQGREIHKRQREARQQVVQNGCNRSWARGRGSGGLPPNRRLCTSTTNRFAVRPELLRFSSHVSVSRRRRLAGSSAGLIRRDRGRSLLASANCPSRGPSASCPFARND